MKEIFEDFNEFDIPTDDSDSVKTVRGGISHQDKNVLINNKGKVKEEDFSDFGIETVQINHNEDIERNDYKILIQS